LVTESLGLERTIRYLLDLLDALEALHSQHVIHRDIKPSNVIISNDGPVLVDLGSSIVTKIGGELTPTFTGTIGYAALDQLFGKADESTDLFALGRLTIQMLTGLMPISSLQESVDPALEEIRHMDPRLAGILEAMVSEERGKRFHSVAEVRAAINGNVVPKGVSQRQTESRSLVKVRPLYFDNMIQVQEEISIDMEPLNDLRVGWSCYGKCSALWALTSDGQSFVWIETISGYFWPMKAQFEHPVRSYSFSGNSYGDGYLCFLGANNTVRTYSIETSRLSWIPKFDFSCSPTASEINQLYSTQRGFRGNFRHLPLVITTNEDIFCTFRPNPFGGRVELRSLGKVMASNLIHTWVDDYADFEVVPLRVILS
jgi:serine/threonine protein kinase